MEFENSRQNGHEILECGSKWAEDMTDEDDLFSLLLPQFPKQVLISLTGKAWPGV